MAPKKKNTKRSQPAKKPATRSAKAQPSTKKVVPPKGAKKPKTSKSSAKQAKPRKLAPGNATKSYFKIVRIFRAMNQLLPENKKLSYGEIYKIVSDVLYPQYRGISYRKISVRDVQFKIEGILDQIPEKEVTNVNLIPDEIITIIDWFAIDETIERIIPDNAFVRVNAGEYGMTSIFNTRDYPLHKRAVLNIINRLRDLAENASELEFTGIKKLRPNHKNDGTPENYFIDFVLNIQGQPVDNTTAVNYQITPDQKKEQKSVRDLINEKMASLKSEKQKKRRAKKTFGKNLTELKEASKLAKKAKAANSVRLALAAKIKAYEKAIAALDRDFKKGLIKKRDYEIMKKHIYENYNMGRKSK